MPSLEDERARLEADAEQHVGLLRVEGCVTRRRDEAGARTVGDGETDVVECDAREANGNAMSFVPSPHLAAERSTIKNVGG